METKTLLIIARLLVFLGLTGALLITMKWIVNDSSFPAFFVFLSAASALGLYMYFTILIAKTFFFFFLTNQP